MQNENKYSSYEDVTKAFVLCVRTELKANEGEIALRNEKIQLRDQFIYSDLLERSLDIPVGHDKTPVNWLRRTVEIHANQFMVSGFQVISTYNSDDVSIEGNDEEAEQEKQRLTLMNRKRKEYAELRKNTIDGIIEDNGGIDLFVELAENAGAVGDSAVKTWYDEKNKTFVITPIESIENLRALWTDNNFRQADAYGYVYQISKVEALARYNKLDEETLQTSPAGQPFDLVGDANSYTIQPGTSQEMVSVIEVTGKISGYGSENGVLKVVPYGQENELNVLIVGSQVIRVIDKPSKIPRFYVFPNKRARRRAWGISDITDGAIYLNVAYVETLSDWRTVANRVNFPKWKAYNFAMDAQLPKPKPRSIQVLALGEGQDMQLLQQGDSNQIDFKAQLEEIKQEYLREVGVSRVYFDDPSINLNSNQALLTSMKPTTDIAEEKKKLWEPIMLQLFNDALETIAAHDDTVGDLIQDKDWKLKIQWPSVMPKDDPVYQSNLLNRFNSGNISLQTYLEKQGESKEEIDRIRDELRDPVTAAILGKQIPLLAQQLIAPPSNGPKTSISLRGDLTPYQEANLASQQGFNEGPFPASAGPQGQQGQIAQANADNMGFLNGDPFNGGTAIQRGPDGQPVQAPQQGMVTTPGQNQTGQQPVSQPGSGATATSAGGAVKKTQQNQGA
jgi:hypothetical protein